MGWSGVRIEHVESPGVVGVRGVEGGADLHGGDLSVGVEEAAAVADPGAALRLVGMLDGDEVAGDVAGEGEGPVGGGDLLEPVDATSSVAGEHLGEDALVDVVSVLEHVNVRAGAAVRLGGGHVFERSDAATAAPIVLDGFTSPDGFDDGLEARRSCGLVVVESGDDDVAPDRCEVEDLDPLSGFAIAADWAAPSAAAEGRCRTGVDVRPSPDATGMGQAIAEHFVPRGWCVEIVERGALEEGGGAEIGDLMTADCLR